MPSAIIYMKRHQVIYLTLRKSKPYTRTPFFFFFLNSYKELDSFRILLLSKSGVTQIFSRHICYMVTKYGAQ